MYPCLFFNDAKRSSADAILYGYLAPLIKAPFPNPSLQNHVKANENLWKFVSHINLTYFAKVGSDYQRKKAEDQENLSNSKTGNEGGGTGYASDPNYEPINKTNMFLAGGVAVSAMTAYAFHSGLVDIVKNIKILNFPKLPQYCPIGPYFHFNDPEI